MTPMRLCVALMVVVVLVTPARADNVERARAYFQAAVDAYDQGRYELALREFQHAHALSHNAALYFNMAACEEHMDHFQAASLLLRQYLIEKPDAEDHDNVEARIKGLEERDERLHKMVEDTPIVAAPKPAPAPAPVVMEKPRPHFKYAWIALGVTAAAGAAALGTGIYSITRHDALKSGCGATAAGCSASDRSSLDAATRATDALIAITAVGAVGTVIAFVLEARQHPSPSKQARVHFTGAGVTF